MDDEDDNQHSPPVELRPPPRRAFRRARGGLLVLGLMLHPWVFAEAAEPGAPNHASPSPSPDGARIVEQQCSGCHRFEGEARSKFEIRGPELMWAGQKFQRPWLIGYLQGKRKSPYPLAYRWDQPGPRPTHPTLGEKEALAVVDHLEAHAKSPLVTSGSFDLASLTEVEAREGERIFREKSCLGCHQIPGPEDPLGGPVSTHFIDAGLRYDPDWVYAFNRSPSTFAPHSGEYEPDVSEREVRWVTGYMMTLGIERFPFAKPWEGETFRIAEAKRGEEVFRTYCAQCHGLGGGGDGPSAAGLDPKPAALDRMGLDRMDLKYLYELVFYGGSAVGKSSLMPDWGVTLSAEQIADVLAYLRETFTGPAKSGAAVCPQTRSTAAAPPDVLERKNPLEPSAEHLASARELYHRSAAPLACAQCHGDDGDGRGPIGAAYDPPPRNFTCKETMAAVPDGQLFWVIREGVISAGMPPYAALSDEQVWQLVLLLRTYSK